MGLLQWVMRQSWQKMPYPVRGKDRLTVREMGLSSRSCSQLWGANGYSRPSKGEKKSRTVRCGGGNTTQPANLAAMQGLIGSLAGGAMTGGQVDRLVGLRE